MRSVIFVSVNLRISRNPTELNRAIDQYTPFTSNGITYTYSGLKGPDCNHHFAGHMAKYIVIIFGEHLPKSIVTSTGAGTLM